MSDVRNFGMGGHHGPMKSDVWLTPPHVKAVLGSFDLDPCAAMNQPWATADAHYTVKDDGLSQPWFGRVWLNPPYGKETSRWLNRLSAHGRGTALVFARTETTSWQEQVWCKASAILFLKGRLRFCNILGEPQHGAGAPSALIAYGPDDAEILQKCGLPGAMVVAEDCNLNAPQQLWLIKN